MRRILIVDDDPSISQMLVDYLSNHDFRTDVVNDSEGVRRHLATETPDAILVDMNLGEEDGMAIVRDFAGRITAPIFIMSGKRLEEADKVEGLEMGARDYIAKPFSLREVLARIRGALDLQVSRAPPSKVFVFDDWRLSTRHRRLSDPLGSEVKLTAAEFNLLVAFLSAAGRILSREDLVLATRVHDQEIFDRSVDVLVLRLRRKLERVGKGKSYIKTERGAGYIFDGNVRIETPRSFLR